jgi:putative ABC transport system permease protein
MGGIWRKLMFLFRRRGLERDLDEEMRYHAELTGQPQFGNVTLLKEKSRGEWGFGWVDACSANVRFALRMLRKSPGFTAVVVLTLALGIGANTLVFSVVNAVLLLPLPYANSGQLVLVSESKPETPSDSVGLSYPTFTELQGQKRVFSGVAGLGGHSLVLTGYGEPSEVRTVVVTSEFFSLLSAEPMLGRVFTKDDDQRGAASVVVLSETLWRSRFGADRAIVGRSVNLDMRPYTVIGVMPASFHTPFLNQINQLWIPLTQDPLYSVWMTRPPQQHWMAVIARLRGGITPQRVQAELKAMSAHLAEQYPAEKGWSLGTKPLQETITGDVRLPLLALLGAVGLVLFIACVNIANLLLSRATSRSREIAIRIALGAGSRRIASQLFTECAVLGLLGGAMGTAVAYAGLASLAPLLPADLPRYHSLHVDAQVLLFAIALSLTTALVFGLAPVLSASATRPQTDLGEGGRGGESNGPRRARALLAAGEIALAMILLMGAGLLIRSFAHLTSVNVGFKPDHIVKAMISLPQFQYSKPQQWAAFADELTARLQAQPGMQESAIAGPLPIVDCCITLAFQIDGKAAQETGAADTANYVPASPRYFPVMGIPLLRGRLFSESDSRSAPAVALISEALAKRFFANENPVGKHLTFGFPANGVVSREIVGVVGDVHDQALGKEPGPMMYVPFAQAPLFGAEVVVRSTLSVSAVASAIREVAHGIDRNLPVTDIVVLGDAMKESVAQPRFRTLLLGIFGAIALVLAGVGIFGVISYSVSRRTQELCVRMALGAEPGSLARLVLRETMAMTVIGIAIGVPCALGAARMVRHLLFDVTPYDPVTLPLVCIVLMAVAALAAYRPARRAMKVDPVVALRCQ